MKRIDFLAVPVEDLPAADSWYGDTLGLPRNPSTSGDRWVEYETGNLTLALSTFGGSLALGVDDVAEARSRLEAAGIEFDMDTFDTGVCHGAPFRDPFGNQLQLHHRYAPVDPHEEGTTHIERTDFVSIPVTDRERGIAFYGDTLGLARNEKAHPEWPEFEPGNATLLLVTPEQIGSEFRASAHGVALRVPDVAAEMERLHGAGVPFLQDDVFDSSVCHMAFCSDPDGNAFILHRRYAPFADGSTP